MTTLEFLRNITVMCPDCNVAYPPLNHYNHMVSKQHILGSGGVIADKDQRKRIELIKKSNDFYHTNKEQCIDCNGFYNKYSKESHMKSMKHIRAVGGVYQKTLVRCNQCNKSVASLDYHKKKCNK